jgi:glycolate oxidase iron-sulfur subunit
MGDEDAARRMALHTMESFQDAGSEAIVVPCASCAAQLRHGYPSLFRASGSKLREAAEAFSARVHDLSEFLWAKGFPRLVAKGPEGRPRSVLTYHDPCHLVHGLGIRKEPRELLRALDRWSYREMAGADRCCGMGGSFRVFHPGISRGILGEKMRAIRDSGAQAVATGCMGCWIQLREGVATHHMPAGIFHVAEILWAELREADENTDRLLDGPSAV